MIEWYWALLAFWAGAICAVVLLGLILMAGRDMYPPPERQPRPDPVRDFPIRDDGTRAVHTVTGYDVTDTTTPQQAWPLDRDRIHYRAKP